jgi:microcystin-dependent protein
MQGVVGSVSLFAGNFAPKNWAFCNGQTMSIAQNQALFSLLGTTYGGNGSSTFALPDLRGRAIVGVGQGPDLSNYVLGQSAGGDTNNITTSQMPAHQHPMQVTITPSATASAPSTPNPVNGVYATGTEQMFNPTADSLFLGYNATLTTQTAGVGMPFTSIHPVLGLNYIICLNGQFPQRG